MDELQSIIDRLELKPLPLEGGWFRRYHVSAERDAAGRARSSAIHFLISPEGFSALHRLRPDEVWRWRAGAVAEVLLLGPAGEGRVVRLGPARAEGCVPEVAVPGGWWQGGRTTGAWTLVDCVVTPEWTEGDFELARRADLEASHPAWREWIAALTR